MKKLRFYFTKVLVLKSIDSFSLRNFDQGCMNVSLKNIILKSANAI